MDFLNIITTRSNTESSENSIAINTDIQGDPILEYYKDREWVPLDNIKTINRMARLDDLYTQLRSRDWGIGPRFSEEYGDLYIHTDLHDSPIPVLSKGIRISEHITSDELTENMNKEIDIYYNSLVSARDFLEGSSVVDLWEYPTEYGGTLNLSTLKHADQSPIIRLGVSWIVGGMRKTENLTFTPWKEKVGWLDFQSPLGGDEILVEFLDGRIRVFPGKPEVTECIIHHCSAIYNGIL